MRITSAISAKQSLRYLGIFFGCMIAACSINIFVVPNRLLTGGATGMAIIFHYLADLPIGIQTLVYNIPLLIASYRLMGRNYTIDVIIGTVVFSLCIDATRFLNAYSPQLDEKLLAAIYGGVFNGIGYGIVFRMNGSTGGFDIIGAIIRKYYSMSMGSVIFAFNCVIVSIAGILFGVTPAMLTLVCMYATSLMTDKVIAGINRRKAILIISEKHLEIAEGIMKEVGRGVTFLHGQGAYTGAERNIVMVVVSLTQIAKIKLIVHAVDKRAFMVIISAGEVMGRGFTKPTLTNRPERTDITLDTTAKQAIHKALHGE